MKSDKYYLIGSPSSLFTGKVLSYLKYKAKTNENFKYEEVLASSDIYMNIIIPKTSVRFIPIIIAPNGDVIQDSSVIIDYIEQKFPSNIIPSTPKKRLVTMLIDAFADQYLVMPAMHYRWSFPEQLAYLSYEFGKTAFPQQSYEEQQSLIAANVNYFAKSLPGLGVNEETVIAIEALYLDLLNILNQHFKIHPYLLGDEPTLADIALIGPLYAHLFRDPVPGLIMRTNAPLVSNWVERMMNIIPHNNIYTATDDKPFVKLVNNLQNSHTDDHIPPTIIPLLKMIFDLYIPIVIKTVSALEQWYSENKTTKIPRVIGWQEFNIGNCTSKRRIWTHDAWKWKRIQKCYNEIVDEQQNLEVNKFLNSLDSNMVKYLNQKNEIFDIIRVKNRLRISKL